VLQRAGLALPRLFLYIHLFIKIIYIYIYIYSPIDRLCGLVVKVPGDRSRDPGSIPGATRFFLGISEPGTGSTQPRDDN
jgi:hypothetical protein